MALVEVHFCKAARVTVILEGNDDPAQKKVSLITE
jgi:hypothetical protein